MTNHHRRSLPQHHRTTIAQPKSLPQHFSSTTVAAVVLLPIRLTIKTAGGPHVIKPSQFGDSAPPRGSMPGSMNADYSILGRMTTYAGYFSGPPWPHKKSVNQLFSENETI
ncbi:hypothetical protein L1887_34156 [Cichorium endivia]|nr:hypothetical protein L1887_34156 [Cichorium endivia]